MMKINLLFLSVLGISNNSFSQDTIDLFIWAGQSNAQGWQGDADFYPSDPGYKTNIVIGTTAGGGSIGCSDEQMQLRTK
jgi:hypothetical protein